MPRRAGDRGAVEAGCLPNLLPGGRPLADAAARVDTQTTWGIGSLPALEGRDGDEMLISAADDELAALVVAGIDPDDFGDPEAVLEGLESVDFVISLETRASLVTERANVVFPVSLIHERAGTFVNWEGRHRSFDVVIPQPNGMSDLRVLAALADGLGTDLGFRTAAQARAELIELGAWDGERSEAPDYPALLAAEVEPAGDGGTDRGRAGHLADGSRSQPGPRRRAQSASDRTGAGGAGQPGDGRDGRAGRVRRDRERPGVVAAAGGDRGGDGRRRGLGAEPGPRLRAAVAPGRGGRRRGQSHRLADAEEVTG